MAITDRFQGYSIGVAVKPPCYVASTANLTLSGAQTIDGISVGSCERVLVKDQTNAKENGIYLADIAVWRRSADFDGKKDAVPGTYVYVDRGDTYKQSFWVFNSSSTAVSIDIGSTGDDIEVLQVSLSLSGASAFSKNTLLPLVSAAEWHSTAGLDTSQASIDSSGSTVARTLAARFADTVNPLDYGAVGDGVADDSTKIQDAINTGKPVWLRPDLIYRITTSLLPSSTGGFVLLSDGATLLQSADVKTINVAIGYLSESTVTAFATTSTFDFGGGLSSVTSLTLTTSTGYSVDDVVKVFSDDIAPNTGSSERMGEHGIVGGKSSATVYLKSQLELSTEYSSNIRLARMGESNVFIQGVKFISDSSGDGLGWTADHIHVEGANAPTISDVTITNGFGAGVVVKSCFNALVDKATVSDLRNEPSNNRFGYAVKDHSSNGTLVTGLRAVGGRHAYTTAHTSITAGSTDIASYGKTMFGRVIGGQAFGVLGVAWDFHSDAYKCEFNGCMAQASVVGDTNAGAGFQFRGRSNRIIGGGAYGCQIGLNIYQEFPNSNQDNYIADTHLDGLSIPVLTDGSSTSNITGFKMVKCNTVCTAALKNMFFEYGDFQVVGGQHTLATTSTDNSIFACDAGATLTVKGGEYIFNSATSRYFCAITASSADVYLDGCFDVDGELNAIFTMGGSTANVVARNLDLSAVPSTGANGIRGVGSTAASAEIDYHVRGKPGVYLTTVNLEDQDHFINRVGKTEGKQVWNITTNAPVWASASSTDAIWVTGSGSTAHTPV